MILWMGTAFTWLEIVSGGKGEGGGVFCEENTENSEPLKIVNILQSYISAFQATDTTVELVG